MHSSVSVVLDQIAAERGVGCAATAREAWSGLTGGSGPEDVSQYSVQVYCWAVVVRRTDDPAERVRLVQALAEVLGRLGLQQYAEIAWGPRTRELLRAARQDADGGRSTYERMMHETGILPADTELLTWGSAYGPVEGGLIRRVADTLELASVAGGVRPIGRGAASDRRRVTRDVLLAAMPDAQDAPTLTWVLAERADVWAAAGSSALRSQLLEPVIDRIAVTEPITDGVDLTGPLARLRWLVERCRQPERLTSAGYLPPGTVSDFRAAVGSGRHGVGSGSRELHQAELRRTRQVAQQLRLVRRHAGSLVTAKKAAATASVADLVPLVARRWMDRGPWDVEQQVREVVVAMLLAGPTALDDLAEAVMVVLGELGWRTREGGPLLAQDSYWLAYEPYRELLDVGLLVDPSHTAGLRQA